MVSPPPASVKALVSAIAIAIFRVPSPNWSNSNTPTGPFHTTVPAFMMMSTICCADLGPISKIISSSATSCADFRIAAVFSLPATNGACLPTTTSVAIGMLAPRADIFAIKACAVGTRSFSHSDLPTGWPVALRKVLAMPPPTTIWSTFSNRLSSTVSLVDTLLPPTIATIGRAGLIRALVKASSSWVSKIPAAATGAYFATP